MNSSFGSRPTDPRWRPAKIEQVCKKIHGLGPVDAVMRGVGDDFDVSSNLSLDKRREKAKKICKPVDNPQTRDDIHEVLSLWSDRKFIVFLNSLTGKYVFGVLRHLHATLLCGLLALGSTSGLVSRGDVCGSMLRCGPTIAPSSAPRRMQPSPARVVIVLSHLEWLMTSHRINAALTADDIGIACLRHHTIRSDCNHLSRLSRCRPVYWSVVASLVVSSSTGR